MGTGVISLGYSSWGVKLTTYLYPVLRLRMCGATPVLTVYAFMVCAGKNLPLPFTHINHEVPWYESSFLNSEMLTVHISFKNAVL
jgi:hypothetical protein